MIWITTVSNALELDLSANLILRLPASLKKFLIRWLGGKPRCLAIRLVVWNNGSADEPSERPTTRDLLGSVSGQALDESHSAGAVCAFEKPRGGTEPTELRGLAYL